MQFGRHLAHFGILLAPFGFLLAPFWCPLAPFWLRLAPFWLPLALFWLPLAPFRLPLAHFWLTFGVFWLTFIVSWSLFPYFYVFSTKMSCEIICLHNFDENLMQYLTFWKTNAPSPKDPLPLQSILTHSAWSGTLAVPALTSEQNPLWAQRRPRRVCVTRVYILPSSASILLLDHRFRDDCSLVFIIFLISILAPIDHRQHIFCSGSAVSRSVNNFMLIDWVNALRELLR